ncbi:MAG: lipoprotein NlpD [Pseudomonadota bacterium]
MLVKALTVFLTLLLIGCGGGYATVSDQSLGPNTRRLSADEYRVQSGDTLAAIAFRFGIDYRELARINGIENEDKIYSGQILRTKGSPVAKPSSVVSKKKSLPKSASKPTSKPESDPVPKQMPTNFVWSWPYSGKLLAGFSSKEGGNKGIDLSGKLGDPIKAAADGQIVYAGSGLLGYGNLVIISHGQDFLSAYAHNSRILVKENQQVKAGDVVAELGNTGATLPMLHFEIRKDGKPVNPLGYLPKR